MQSSSKEEICARIAQVRLEVAGPRGKASFAKSLGISASTYDYYETARVPPADLLVRIADVAGVDLTWLLTGRTDTEGHPSAYHPIVQRAAALMADRPDAAKPLAAFIELLGKVRQTFPANTQDDQAPADQQASQSQPQARQGVGHFESPDQMAGAASSLADDPHAIPDTPALPATDMSNIGLQDRGITGVTPDPLPSVSPESPTRTAARQQWVPILGRSAAGVPQFWSVTDDTTGVTTLASMIARHAGQLGRHVQPATLHDGTAIQQAQIITLTSVGAGEVPEYVQAPAIKADYPDAFALRIDGNSMSPDIAHGDLVILSPSAPAIDGRAAVVQLVNQIGVTCKLFRRDASGMHLVPINEELPAVSIPASSVVWALRVLARVRPSAPARADTGFA